MSKFKFEILAGTLSGVIIVAILYANHLGLASAGYLWNLCDAKDILLLGGSAALIVYKKIFFPRKKISERNDKDE